MRKTLRRARFGRALLVASALVAALAFAATAAATVVEEPQIEPAEWPVLETAPSTDVGADPAVVTEAQLASAGQGGAQSSPALAGDGVIVVDDDRAQCPNADFDTPLGIELAVQAAQPGARIRVCPGLYSPVTIDRPVYVQGPLHSGEATQCQTPAVPDPARYAVIAGTRSPALVEISAGGVTFEGLVVQDNAIGYGIATSPAGSGYVIRHNVVQRNRNGVDLNADGAVETSFLFNCVRANGSVFAGTGGTGVLTSAGIRNARVEENYVTGHDCGSIAFTGRLSCLAPVSALPPVVDVAIAHNDVVDDARIAVATATRVTITYNDIRLRFGPAILLSGFGGVVTVVDVSFNHVDGQNAVVTQGIFITPSGPAAASDVRVRANKVENLADVPTFARGHGIVLRAIRTEVHENWIERNRGSGIIVAGPSNRIHGNLIVANGALLPGDVTDGIRVLRGAVGNVIENNRLRENITHDCHDDNPNGINVWRHNVGYTENQPGLCVRPAS